MNSTDWILLKDNQPEEAGLYPVCWPVKSPSPYTEDMVFSYSIEFWNGGAFFEETERLKHITHWFPVIIPFNFV